MMDTQHRDPISALHSRLESASSHLESIAGTPDAYNQAVLDTLVSDLIPGVKEMSASLHKFVVDTVTIVNDAVARISSLERGLVGLEARLSDMEESVGSSLLPEDADQLVKFIVAAMGVISQLPESDKSRLAMLDLGKECLDLINDIRLEDDGEESSDEYEDGSGEAAR